MERFVILLALAGLSYLLLYTEGLVKTSRSRFAVLGVLLAAFAVLLANGTKACYLTFIIICVCGIIMLVIRFIAGDRG